MAGGFARAAGRQLASFLPAIRQHHWDNTLPATALVFSDDQPKRPRYLPRALGETVMSQAERLARQPGWADVGSLHVSQRYRCRKVATWLLGQVADWLELAHVERLLDHGYLDSPDAHGLSHDDDRAFLDAMPFTVLTTTRRGWTRQV